MRATSTSGGPALAIALVLLAAPGEARRPIGALPRRDAVLPSVSRPRGPTPVIRDLKPGAVEQRGEVAILEGDPDLVSDDGRGGLAILYNANVQNPWAIANRFYTVYPDDFDELVLFTSFRDTGTPEALAWETQVQQDVKGLGRMAQSDQSAWGSQGGLYAFVDMKWLDQYPKFDGLPPTDPRSLIYPTLGQEFAHRWLASLLYLDGSGAKSSAMLGRGMVHWAATLQAFGSLLDGRLWLDNRDGSYTVAAVASRYSPLDLYAMGLAPAAQVGPWFLLSGAVEVETGAAVDPASAWATAVVGTRVRARREDITVAQVIAACGARLPAFPASPRAFRVAFLLVTRPGQAAREVLATADAIDGVRRSWEQAFARYTGGAATMCTQLSAPCGTPAARIVDGQIHEGAGANGNGVLEPGEAVTVRFELRNDGTGDATDVKITARAPGLRVAPDPVVLPRLAEGASAAVEVAGQLAEPSDGSASCGGLLTVEGEARTGRGVYRGFVQAEVGIRDAYRAAFSRGGGFWGENLDGTDTAATNRYAWGRPRPYGYYNFYAFQPDGGPGGGAVWFTGLSGGAAAGGSDSGLGKGVATLWSPPVDLSSALRPRIRHTVWLVAVDLADPRLGPVASDTDHLRLEASNDGLRWTQVDQIDGADDQWRVRERPLESGSQLALDRPVQFRYTVNRDGDSETVEAGVAEFAVVAETPACRPGAPDLGMAMPQSKPRGCATGATGSRSPERLGLLAAAALLARALRRRQPSG